MDKQKIFVVDDKDMIGKIIMACLGRDYDCRYFDSPKPVLEQMEAGDLPDLIISDIRMPDMRGDEFLHAVKSDERFRHIRMVLPLPSMTWKPAAQATFSARHSTACPPCMWRTLCRIPAP